MTSAACLLLSGGVDSIALAFWKRPRIAVTIDYGQRAARAEIEAAGAVCRDLGIEHDVLAIDCSAIGSGDMAGTAASPLAPVSEWWPYRNQLLVTLGAARVVGRGITELLLGTVAGDQQHADGTSEFIAAMSRTTQLQEGGVQVAAPAIDLSSPELVRKSQVPIEILAWAHSCHVSDLACGTCRGCNKHYETMKALGIGPY